MKRTKQLSSTFFIIVGLSLIMIGAVILTIILSAQQEENSFMSKAESCTAQVTDVNSYTTRTRNGTKGNYKTVRHYDAYISYTVNGVNYNNVKISDVSSSVETGDQLIIYYDPSNPQNARLKNDSTSDIPRIIMVILIMIAGIVVTALSFVKKRRMSNPQPQISAQDVIPDANSMNSTSTAYNGYENSPQAFSDGQDIYNPNPNQTYNDYGVNPFDTYSGYSQSDNANNFNSQQSSPFDSYNGYSQSDNANNFNSQQSSSFDTYNGYSQSDNASNFNSQQSSPFDTYGNNSQNDSSKPKSPFDRYK